MRKNTLNFIVDLLTLLAILAMIGTGLIMYFTLPPGSGSRGLILWGLGRHDWGDVHFWSSVALGALLVLHVALHWAWVCGTIRRLVHGPSGARGGGRSGLDNLYGVAFLIVLAGFFAGFLLVADAGVVVSAEAAGRHESEHAPARTESPGAGLHFSAAEGDAPEAADEQIRGSMTLAEVSEQTGVAVAELLAALQWPADTPAQERFGRLCRAHGMEMAAARRIIADRVAQGRNEP
jgi:hypothetical protein